MAQPAIQEQTYSREQEPRGLTHSEVQQRIRDGLTNNYKARVSRSYWEIVRDNLLNLFNIVIFTLLIIVIALGDYATAVFSGFSVVSNTFLGMIQEINAKRRLDRLATLSQQTAHVYRDGKRTEIAIKDVVKDDLLHLEPGDRIVVDAEVVDSNAMEVDESLLTGESDSVFKTIDGDNEVLSGSFVIAGTGLVRATRVGAESNINKLSEIAKQYKRTKTPTQNYIDIIVEITVVVMFIFVPLLMITDLIVDQISFLNAIRNAVVFVTSLVPQGLVLVAILSLTIGAIKISLQQTLVQKVNAVESLANATVLCFDKTGTLTRNELNVTELISLNNTPEDDIRRDLHRYLHGLSHLNRTAGAVKDYVDEHVKTAPQIDREREIPFNSSRKWGAVVFNDVALVLGAPERLLPQTAHDDSVASRALRLSSKGYRVLAFARADTPPDGNFVGHQVEPVALIVLSDKIREDIHETLQAFRDEGLELKVISGDNVETVRAIASQSGMTITEAYTGETLDAMNDEELEVAALRGNVFARVQPETKRRIVDALQRRKEYVAMVGDGVNDVPALKQANLAIVMNDGTQISKDVADIVLLNNAMSTLPRAFAEGKEITQTIFGTMKIFLVRNLYNVLLFIMVLFMALPFPITPVQISWSTFGTVNMPATLIAFGIVRPKFIRNFRDDVVDFVVTGGLIGSILMTVLYVGVYFGTDKNIEATRSAVTILLTFFAAYIIMAVQGINFYRPRTFIEHWRITLLMTVLSLVTILSMYAFAPLFEFYIFDPAQDELWVYVLIYALLVLGMILLAHGMRYRYLLKRMWHLFQRD